MWFGDEPVTSAMDTRDEEVGAVRMKAAREVRLRSLAEKNFLHLGRTRDDAYRITAGARGKVVCAGDLDTVEQWLLRYNERIEAEVRRATRSREDDELEIMAGGGPVSATMADLAAPDPPTARRVEPDVDAAAVVHCAVITSQLGTLSELLFCNPDLLLGDVDDPLHMAEFIAVLRRAADTLEGLLPRP